MYSWTQHLLAALLLVSAATAPLSADSRLGFSSLDAGCPQVEVGASAELPLDSSRSYSTTTAEYLVAANSARNVLTNISQLQSKFKHAGDFGIVGNANKATLQAFESAIQNFVKSPGTQRIVGTYRGKAAVIYVDAESGLAVITDTAGNFISGWKLSAQQLWHVLNGGKLGGG